MYLVSQERLTDWLQTQLDGQVEIQSRHVLDSFQQYAERLQLTHKGQSLQCVFRTYMARFNLWPPFDLDLGQLVADALRGLQHAGLPAAHVLGQGAYLGPAQALLIQWLPGDSIRWPVDEERIVAIAQMMARLHATVPALTLPSYPLSELLMDLQLFAEQMQLADAQAALAHIQPRLGSEQAVWVHGDAHPGNFLWQESGGISPIDWDETGIADYRFDVAYAWALFARRQDESAAACFLQAYQAASGRQVENLAAWWCFLNIRDYIAVEHLRRQHPADSQRSDVANWLEFGESSAQVMREEAGLS